MAARKVPGWLLAFAIGVPALVAGWIVYTTYFAPLPTKAAGEMVADLLEGSAAFSEALSTAGREGDNARVYIRFVTTEPGIEHLVQRFGLLPGELSQLQIDAIRNDERMPEWWRPQAELAPGTFWSGVAEGWGYELYFNPANGATYFLWTWL